MYAKYWELSEKPFENTPDPRFMYRSAEHEEGLSRLLYAVGEGKGAALLTGVFGCGKTLLARTVLKELDRDVYRNAYIANPFLTYPELLMHIAHSLGANDLPRSKSEVLLNVVIEKINDMLLNNIRDGKKTVVIIDEAHVIRDKDIWEGLRLLLNFQLEDRFLLTLLLLGQPELKEIIETNKQLVQRIPVRCHLTSLSEEDTIKYILHRLKVAGREKETFSEGALKQIHNKSGGIPRRINHISDLALFTAFGKEKPLVDEDLIKEVALDIQ